MAKLLLTAIISLKSAIIRSPAHLRKNPLCMPVLGTPVATEKSGLFGTLGAYPDSDHARQCLKNARALVKGNEILGEFLCQGKVDPALIKIMETKMMDAPHHSMTPERRARLEEAAKHPDEKDLADARALFFKLAQIAAGKVSA